MNDRLEVVRRADLEQHRIHMGDANPNNIRASANND